MKADVGEIRKFIASGKQITRSIRGQVSNLKDACSEANSLGDTRIAQINAAAGKALDDINKCMDELDTLWPILEQEVLSIITENNKVINIPTQGGRHR